MFLFQTGKVKLTVVSKTGKEATIGIVAEDNFSEKARFAGQALGRALATALTDCAILRIDRKP